MRHHIFLFGARHYEKPSTGYGDLENILLAGAYVAFSILGAGARGSAYTQAVRATERRYLVCSMTKAAGSGPAPLSAETAQASGVPGPSRLPALISDGICPPDQSRSFLSQQQTLPTSRLSRESRTW